MKFAKISKFLKDENLLYCKEKALKEIMGIKDCFQYTIDEKEYWIKFLHNNSTVIKAATFRFFTREIKEIFYNAALEVLHGGREDFLFHPIFYLRISRQDVSYSKDREFCILDSQPHYDRSLGVPARTFWVALNPANKNTGGLCFFSESKSIDELFKVRWDQKNKYNYFKYLEEYQKLDKKISQFIIHPDLLAGDAYSFGSDELHAGTRPIASERLSFDFRLIRKENLNLASKQVKKLVYFFNENMELSNALNLHVLGDKFGRDIYIRDNLYPIELFNKIPFGPDLGIPRNYHWQEEYSWIEHM